MEPPSSVEVDDDVYKAVVSGYYAMATDVGERARRRAQMAQAAASAISGLVVAAALVKEADPPWHLPSILVILTVGAWATSAALYGQAMATRGKKTKPTRSITSRLNFVEEAIAEAMADRDHVERLNQRAGRATIAALLLSFTLVCASMLYSSPSPTPNQYEIRGESVAGLCGVERSSVTVTSLSDLPDATLNRVAVTVDEKSCPNHGFTRVVPVDSLLTSEVSNGK